MALTDKLTNIAEAIRIKTGTTETMTLDEMPSKIESIETSEEVEIKTLDDLKTEMNNSLNKYLDMIPESYPTHTNTPVTLYTPNASNMYYMIRKRNEAGTSYGIVWLPKCVLYVKTYNTINTSELSYRVNKNITTDYTDDEISTTNISIIGYSSPNYTTYEECIQAIQDPNTTYTASSSSNSWSSYRDDNFDIIATNLPSYTFKNEISKTYKISSNEIIEII